MSDLAGALEAARRAVLLAPTSADAHCTLGNVLVQHGDDEEAVRAYTRAIELEPTLFKPYGNLGVLASRRGDHAEAVRWLRDAVSRNPRSFRFWTSLGNSLAALGEHAEAVDAFRASVALEPSHAALFNLGSLLFARGEDEEAERILATLVARHPEALDAAVKLASETNARGNPPSALSHTGIDFIRGTPSIPERGVFEAIARWAEALPRVEECRLRPSDDSRLRVGYLATRLFRDPHTRSIAHVLRAHDRQRFLVFLYVASTTPAQEAEARALAEVSREVSHLADAQIAALMAADQLDVLVNLEGHERGSRLAVSRHRPAPVQIAYLGTKGTTGLPLIGFRLVDSTVVAAGDADRWSSERLVRVDRSGDPASVARALERIYSNLARAYGFPETASRVDHLMTDQEREGDPLGQSLRHLERGEHAAAFEEVASALARDPECPGVAELLFRLPPGGELADRTQEALVRVAAQSPAPHWALLIGSRLVAVRSDERALAVATNGLKRFPEIDELALIGASAAFRLRRFDEAEALIGQVGTAWASSASAHTVRADLALLVGDYRSARAAFRAGVALAPENAALASDYLLASAYDPATSPTELAEEHRAWGRRYATNVRAKTVRPAIVDRDPGRRLRVGFVSGDFSLHAVACFALPLLEAFDRRLVSVHAYSASIVHDYITERFEKAVDRFREVSTLPDATLAEEIARDEIDVLVDLSGHTGRSRLSMFAYAPAPIQVTYLGYPNTTGVSSVQYRLTDAVADPVGVESLYTEELIRLPHGAWAYRPFADVTLLAPSRRAAVTFGSFNNVYKISDEVLSLWAEILRAVPDSRLFLKTQAFSWEKARVRTLDRLGAAGIDHDRVRLEGVTAGAAEHLLMFDEIDVALDPFPYGGTTSTCDALWMGVPVVSLLGDRHSARVGASLLTSVGLEECIAHDLGEYVSHAVHLARSEDRRRELRGTLRKRFLSSPVGRPADLACDMERAFRTMWKRHLALP